MALYQVSVFATLTPSRVIEVLLARTMPWLSRQTTDIFGLATLELDPALESNCCSALRTRCLARSAPTSHSLRTHRSSQYDGAILGPYSLSLIHISEPTRRT